MADKMRRTFPVPVTLSAGEQPTATKISAIGSQARSGLGIVETAIGDIWTQSGDSILTGTDSDFRKWLQIPNIGRTIGVANSLSGTFDEDSVTMFFDGPDVFGEITANINSFGLHIIPDSTIETFTSWYGGDSIDPVAEDSILNVDANGEWYYDAKTHKFHIYWDDGQYTPINSNFAVGYDVNSFPYETNATANIVPYREQDLYYNGIKIISTGTSSQYYIFLPPKIRCNISEGTSSTDRPVYIGNRDITSNFYSENDSGNCIFWSDLATAPDLSNSDYDHYRYRLPTILGFNSLSAGTRLPDGFIQLYDNTKGTVVDNVVFYKPISATYTACDHCILMVVGGDTTDIDADISTQDPLAGGTDLVTHYDTRFSIVTVGTSIAERINWLERAFLAHNHKPSSICATARLDHMAICNLDPPATAAHMPTSVVLTASAWESDGHLQYLSRLGSIDHTNYPAGARDIYNGAILGDIVIGSTTKGAVPFFNNTTSDSNKIFFGKADIDTAPHLYGTSVGLTARSNGSNMFGIRGLSTSGYGVYGVSTSGYGVYGLSNSSYGVVAGGNPTCAPLRIEPQSVQPSATAKGQLYYDSDDDTLYVYDGAWTALN